MATKVKVIHIHRIDNLQEELDKWLEQNTKAQIEHVTHCLSGRGTAGQMSSIVCIWYNEGG